MEAGYVYAVILESGVNLSFVFQAAVYLFLFVYLHQGKKLNDMGIGYSLVLKTINLFKNFTFQYISILNPFKLLQTLVFGFLPSYRLE